MSNKDYHRGHTDGYSEGRSSRGLSPGPWIGDTGPVSRGTAIAIVGFMFAVGAALFVFAGWIIFIHPELLRQAPQVSPSPAGVVINMSHIAI